MTMGAILVDKANVLLKSEEEKPAGINSEVVYQAVRAVAEMAREIDKRGLKDKVIDIEPINETKTP
jgi:hypothetical protein